MKVHSKIGLIEKVVSGKKKRYGFISTGNFNEETAKIYTDYTLLTSNQKILKEVFKAVFSLRVLCGFFCNFIFLHTEPVSSK